jgi:hypothetical protein
MSDRISAVVGTLSSGRGTRGGATPVAGETEISRHRTACVSELDMTAWHLCAVPRASVSSISSTTRCRMVRAQLVEAHPADARYDMGPDEDLIPLPRRRADARTHVLEPAVQVHLEHVGSGLRGRPCVDLAQ